MLSKTHTQLVFWLAVSAMVALTTIVALLIWDTADRRAESEKVGPTTDKDVPAQPPAASLGSEMPPAMLASSEPAAAVDPRDVCDKPLRELSEECLLSLDVYFWDKPFVWHEFDWLPLPLTYRRIFADPAADREKVFSALEKPECRLEDGEVRWDLKESCHAESFANYANFLYFCQYAEDSWRSDVELMQDLGYGPGVRTSVYGRYASWDRKNNRPSTWAGERLLEGRWIVERTCRQHDTTTLALDSERYAKLMAIWERLGERTGSYGRAFEVLISLAARLGDEWASFIYKSPEEDDAWDDHEAERMPWKFFLRTMRSKMGQPSVKYGSDGRAQALRCSLEAWGELEKADLEIDLDRLVDYVCGGNWHFAREPCAVAIANLQKKGDSTEQGLWHRLSVFEARAIQIGQYDVVTSDRSSDWESKELHAADPDGFHVQWTGRTHRNTTRGWCEAESGHFEASVPETTRLSAWSTDCVFQKLDNA